jgi:outer membrane receptor protein involved in Fe transport
MRCPWVSLALFAAALCRPPAYAQTANGAILLQVQDPSGAPIEASGKLNGPGTHLTFHTDARGVYSFDHLPYGRFNLEISSPGFAPQSLPVDVPSGVSVSRTVTLALATFASEVDVVAATPLPGVELLPDQVPAPVQTAAQSDIEKSGALDLSDFLSRRLNGVYLNEMQGNPFQPDVNYRGYTASPLLGTPQGVSVYVDGVRQNQPFGDVVAWDLIPRNAISEVTLIPGSNPVFGLNTLGGALAIRTKDGAGSPGLSAQLTYGSSGRKALQAEEGGGKAGGFNWFVAANVLHESGWRFDSPSGVRQGFARLGWRIAKTTFALTTAYADNMLTGNGLQDYRLLAANYSSVYTIPDTTGNRSPSINLRAQTAFSDSLTFSGNAWFRNIRTEGVNGNLNTDALGQQPSTALCIAQAAQLADPDQACNAVTVYSKTVQNDYGLSGQATWLAQSRTFHSQFTAGAVYGRGGVDYTQNTQYGYLNPDRTITGVNAWQDGSTTSGGVPVDTRVNLHGATPNESVFATDTLTIAHAWNVTLSGRYNRDSIDNSDRLNPGGGPGSLDARDVFSRFDGSAGVTYNFASTWNAYAGYGQGSRAPTSIELGCADPNNPCNLPNALAGDPPLKQVVTGTWETGVRGKLAHIANWNLGAFRADNHDDILFVASQQTGAGYFKNFGETRREGIQASVDARFRRISAGLDYTFLDATYQSTETFDGSFNSSSDLALAGMPGLGGVITVHPGNRIPLIPKQTGKAYAGVQATSKLVFDFGLVANSSSYARGNENNADQPDGKYYLGPGVSPGYAVLNAAAHYSLTRRLQLAAQVDNLLDRHYYTAAQLAATGFTAQGAFVARPFPANANGDYPTQSATFYAPGAPRRAWMELRLRF